MAANKSLNLNHPGVGCTALSAAAVNGHHECVKALVDAQADVDKQNKEGCAPIYRASVKGHTEVVKVLIAAGAKIDILNLDKNTPLYAAAWNGHVETLKVLIEAKANVDQVLEGGCTALLAATHMGHYNCIEALIEANAEVDRITYPNKNGITPLHWAINHKKTMSIRALLNNEADPDMAIQNSHGLTETPLQVAAYHGNPDIINMLVKYSADVDLAQPITDASPMYMAVCSGKADNVQALVRANAAIDISAANGVTPLALAGMGLTVRSTSGEVKRSGTIADTFKVFEVLTNAPTASFRTVNMATGSLPLHALCGAAELSHWSMQRANVLPLHMFMRYAAHREQLVALSRWARMGAVPDKIWEGQESGRLAENSIPADYRITPPPGTDIQVIALADPRFRHRTHCLRYLDKYIKTLAKPEEMLFPRIRAGVKSRRSADDNEVRKLTAADDEVHERPRVPKNVATSDRRAALKEAKKAGAKVNPKKAKKLLKKAQKAAGKPSGS